MPVQPVAMDDTSIGAFDYLCDNIGAANLENSVGASGRDITFLTDILNDPVYAELIQAQDALEDCLKINPVSCDNIELVKDISDELAEQGSRNSLAKELRTILRTPHFQAMIETHDDVASKNYDVVPPEAYPLITGETILPQSETTNTYNSTQSFTQDAIRMVGIRKTQDEALGITVRSDDGGLTIARILPGSVVEKQGLLYVGDIIKEISGQEVLTPDQLQDMMKKSTGTITFKIIPSSQDQNSSMKIFLKAHFSYDPKKKKVPTATLR